MSYRIAVCDDEPSQLESISSLVADWSLSCGQPCQIRQFPSAQAFLFAYEENSAFDILLLDVEMEGMSGIQLARQLRAARSRAEIVFITSHFEFIGEGYEVDALHYLVKPVSRDKLFSVLSRAAWRLSVEPPHIIISCDGETVKLYEADILYVESFLHYISIHTVSREYRIKEGISSFAAKLGDDFYRVHRSYLVSLKHITRISRTSVRLEDGTELPVARGKYDDINLAFIRRN